MIYFNIYVKTASKGCLSLGEQMPSECDLLPCLAEGSVGNICTSSREEMLRKYMVLSWPGTWWTFGFSPHIPAPPWLFAFWSRPQVTLQVSLARGRVSILLRGEIKDCVLAGCRDSGLPSNPKDVKSSPLLQELKTFSSVWEAACSPGLVLLPFLFLHFCSVRKKK